MNFTGIPPGFRPLTSPPEATHTPKLEISEPIYQSVALAQDLPSHLLVEGPIKRKRGRPAKDTCGTNVKRGVDQSQQPPSFNPHTSVRERPTEAIENEIVKLGRSPPERIEPPPERNEPPPERNEHETLQQVPPSPEQITTEIDPFSMLRPFLRPQLGKKLTPEELKQSLSIAQGVKKFLISRLTSMSNINTMISSANDAFSTLTFLHDSYESFYVDICELIRYKQQLLADAEEKSSASSLKARYEQLVVHTKDAEQALLKVEKYLKTAREKQLLIEKIAKEREVLRKLEEELLAAASVEGVEALEAEQHRLAEVLVVAGEEMAKYRLLSEEADVKLTDIQRHEDEAKAGIEKIRNKYLTPK